MAKNQIYWWFELKSSSALGGNTAAATWVCTAQVMLWFFMEEGQDRNYSNVLNWMWWDTKVQQSFEKHGKVLERLQGSCGKPAKFSSRNSFLLGVECSTWSQLRVTPNNLIFLCVQLQQSMESALLSSSHGARLCSSSQGIAIQARAGNSEYSCSPGPHLRSSQEFQPFQNSLFPCTVGGMAPLFLKQILFKKPKVSSRNFSQHLLQSLLRPTVARANQERATVWFLKTQWEAPTSLFQDPKWHFLGIAIPVSSQKILTPVSRWGSPV